MSNMGFRVEIDDINAILARRGLEKQGEVQTYIDSEVVRLCDPYVPFLNGVLKTSPKAFSPPGSGEVIYNTPYARRQYYEQMSNYSNQNGHRGRLWFERMKSAHLGDILNGAKKIAGAK